MKYLFSIILVYALNITAVIGQQYINFGDSTGFDMSVYQNELNTVAAEMIDSLPEIFREDFRVYSMSFYWHHNKFNGGTSEMFENAIQRADLLSPYYIIMGLELSNESENNKIHISIKLPNEWLENCFDEAFILSKITSIKLKYIELSKAVYSQESYFDAEVIGMRFIANIFGEINCCLPGRSEEECSGCLSAINVYDNLILNGFIPLANCTIENRDLEVDQNCLCSNIEGIRSMKQERNRTSEILDLANFQIKIDSIDYNLFEVLQEGSENIEDFFGVITKNVTFCDPGEVSELNELYSSNSNSVWLHIWENPARTDGRSSPNETEHIIFFKGKFASVDNDIDCGLEAFKQANIKLNPANFQYTISQRCFAPWDWFGHFPVLPGVHIWKNSMRGDNRGFSLKPFGLLYTSDPYTKAKARLYQYMTFTLKGDVLDNAHQAGQTVGYRNFQKLIPANAFEPAHPAELETDFAVTSGKEEILEKIINGVHINMNIQGADPLVHLVIRGTSMFTPDIENTVKMNIYYEPDEASIHLHGSVCTKNFPAHEVLIEDKCGNRLFLNTTSSPCESELGIELMFNVFDHHDYFDFRIPVDNNGCFLDNIVKMAVDRSTGTELDNSILSISEWNNTNLNKPPAVDCPSLPCEGCYRNNGDDLRTYFNCNGN